VNYPTDKLTEQLNQLVAKACSHPPNSTKRQEGLTQIVRVVMKSGKLWKENNPYYGDALQQTWLYFTRNICEATTGAKYDAEISSVTTWLNAYLRKRLLDFRLSSSDEEKQRVKPCFSKEQGPDQEIDPLDNLPAPPDIPPILEITRNWATTDLDGELRHVHIQGYPKVNCQVLILRRLPPETPWETLATEFGLSISTLNNFYRRQCMPRLRKFGESQGYI